MTRPLPVERVHVDRSVYRRLVFRRLFYSQLPKILAYNILHREQRPRAFVARMGGIGDLTYAFAVIERLAERYAVDVGTGPPPYVTFVRSNPNVRRVFAPFVYKATKTRHATLIRRLLGPFYERIVLLDTLDGDWWDRGKHVSRVFAEEAGVSPPETGRVYLSSADHDNAEAYIRRTGSDEFIYVAQVIRHHRPWRSWPLEYFHEIYRLMNQRLGLRILVDTTGSDETEIPSFCERLDRLDIMTAAAIIQRAKLFIGLDGGLAHVAAALGTATVVVQLGYPADWCRALGQSVRIVTQRQPFDDPANTSPQKVFETICSAV